MGLFSSCFGEVEQQDYGTRRVNSGRRVTKAMIGVPTNFVHTGHLGIGQVQQGEYPSTHNQDKLRIMMAQVGASLDDSSDDMFDLPKTEPRQPNVGMAY
ncbi:hypothetical protein EC988_001772 [Linderina pennispora]|nr:hypothetical protein EC988_001772 [Linderina pennispora]